MWFIARSLKPNLLTYLKSSLFAYTKTFLNIHEEISVVGWGSVLENNFKSSVGISPGVGRQNNFLIIFYFKIMQQKLFNSE